MEISTPPLCPFPAVSSIFLPSSPLFLPFRISMPFPVSFWSAIPPNCLPSPGVFPPSLLSRRSWKKFSGNRSFEPYLQKHLIFPRKLPAESLPCVPSTGCCSAKNASMNSRRSPMIRNLCEIYSGSFGQKDFSHTKRTRAAYTGPKKREKSIYEKAITALLNPIIEFNCDESVSERRTFFKKVLRKSKLFHSDFETTVKRRNAYSAFKVSRKKLRISSPSAIRVPCTMEG